jgi:glycosyltransferase involved in cell wall biosynthesis
VPRPLLQVISADHRRGAEISATDLRDALADRGLDPELIALRHTREGPTLDVPTLGTRRFGNLGTLRRRARASRGVLAHGSDTLPAVYLATRATGVPFVYRSIGDPRYWSHRLDRRLRVGVELRAARAVVATFAAAADSLVEDHGLDPARVHVIPNGRPLARFPAPTDAERLDARQQTVPSLDPATPVVAFLGSLAPEKAPELAVRVVAQLPHTHLILAGDGPLRRTVEAYGESVAPGRVHPLGPVEDPRQVLLAADVVLLPSRSEGFAGVAVEAGLTGRPVVATDVGAARDIIQPGITGFVADEPDPGLLADLVDRAMAERTTLGAAGRARCIEEFELAVVADRWQALLTEVLP